MKKMNLEKWKKLIKQSKKSKKHYTSSDIKVKVNSDKTKYIISHVQICNCCKHEKIINLKVKFKKSHKIILFEGYLLILLFGLNLKPIDYSMYHNCISGQRFIENIENIKIKTL